MATMLQLRVSLSCAGLPTGKCLQHPAMPCKRVPVAGRNLAEAAEDLGAPCSVCAVLRSGPSG